jgi:hypothetical protein
VLYTHLLLILVADITRLGRPAGIHLAEELRFSQSVTVNHCE